MTLSALTFDDIPCGTCRCHCSSNSESDRFNPVKVMYNFMTWEHVKAFQFFIDSLFKIYIYLSSIPKFVYIIGVISFWNRTLCIFVLSLFRWLKPGFIKEISCCCPDTVSNNWWVTKLSEIMSSQLERWNFKF